MKCVRNSVRIVDRSGVHSRPLHTKLAHTHIHTRTRAFWKFDIFQFSLLLGQAACLPASLPACLHFMMATPITTDTNSFPFIHSFFFFILANRKLLKCHTDISYSMQIYVYILYNTYLYISVCVCVCGLYVSFHTRFEVEANEKYANEIVTQFPTLTHTSVHCYFICMRMRITLKYNAIHEISSEE